MKVSAKLLRWYNQNRRDLPWRKTQNPYHILVSEIMLQQTQVGRVIDFYKAWLKRFPSWKALAAASNAEVIQQWSGLGYNRRALVLRDIAMQVTQKGIPQSRNEWLALKGIGPYTSAAVALFSQGEKVFPIDSIIRRVMGRFYYGKPFPIAELDPTIEKAGMKLLDESERYQDIPQALFDLASKICSKDPKCSICPLKNECKASKKFLSGKVKIPKRSLPKAKERIHRNKKYPDRIYRGRILNVVMTQKGKKTKRQIAKAVDRDYDPKLDKEWMDAIFSRLRKEGLLEIHNNKYSLKE